MCKVVAIGTDLCAIARIERAIARPHFYERVFLENERAYLETKGRARASSAAAMFAAKEAVAKALGTGFSAGVMPWGIEVTHAASGAPGIALHGAAAERLAAVGGARVLLSLTHEGDLAQAFAVIQSE
ncbi:MAG: holo-ACP synthase [Candidatus Ventricola sp.]